MAERFLVDDDGVVDLATGESVRLSIDSARCATRARVAMCDRLFALRHPLLLPLVDYGAFGDHWFEAHANLPALCVPAGQARATALHLVRFLRWARVELDAAAVARHVRAAVEGQTVRGRPVGVRLQPRSALEVVRTVLEANGPPGVMPIVVHAPHGAGLRTARVQLARIARQAGYLVIDSRFGALDEISTPPRHLCVFDWLPASPAMPSALAFADLRSGRRHAWIRFCRHSVSGTGSIGLEPLMTRDLTNAIYLDPELGPTAAEVRCAVASADGDERRFLELLATGKDGRGQPCWVHETAPEYVVRPLDAGAVRPVTAGVARLTRAVDVAMGLARRGRHARAVRVLARCGPALAARGALPAAASAALALGELCLVRGKLPAAANAFERARAWHPQGACVARASLGAGRVLLEQGRLHEAEGALRTAIVCAAEPHSSEARRALVELMIVRGRLDAAEEIAGSDEGLLTATAEIRRLQGDLAGATRCAAQAIAASRDAVDRCEAHVAAARVYAALGDIDAVRRHGRAARLAGREARQPLLRLRIAADLHGCLERAGGPAGPAMRARLLRIARRLPPLTAARMRAALNASLPADAAMLPSPSDATHLIQRFRALVDAIHDAPDEVSALQVLADDLLRVTDACSVVIRSAALARAVADAGRPWPNEAGFTAMVLQGGAPEARDGLTPEAAEPITSGGSIIGALAVRWVPGARPPIARIRDLLRTTAVAAAPALKAVASLREADTAADPALYPDDLLGRGALAERVRDAIRRAAFAPYPVLIEGESGSGKELVARAIHARSNRRVRKFCAVNCAALADDLLEAELFGHARGAFTGAIGERAGLFEEADQGTIFLDEAGELSARAQAKLLRVLQEGEIRRVGENVPRKVDARVVAATNRRLEDEVAAGRFRADLRFRLDVIRIALPPLRERADDIPWLADRFWAEAAARVGTRATMGEDLRAALTRYQWPGNVRELQNVIASLAVHGPRRGRIGAALLPAHIGRAVAPPPTAFDEARLEFERRFVGAALARAGGRRSTAAVALGVSRQGLDKIIKRLGLQGG